MSHSAAHDAPLRLETQQEGPNQSVHRLLSTTQKHVITDTEIKTTVDYAQHPKSDDMPVRFEVTISGWVWTKGT